MKLIADPLEVGVFVRTQALEHWLKQAIVFLERFEDRGGGQIQLGQAPAAVFHLFDEFQWGFVARQYAGSGSGGDGCESDALPGFKAHLAQTADKAALDTFGVRLEKPRHPLKMNA